MPQVTNAAVLNILNLDFNLYDQIISFTVLKILQTQMFLKFITKTSVLLGPFNMRCEVQ